MKTLERWQKTKLSVLVYRYKRHIFPLVALLIFLIFGLLRISGTSIGIYQEYLYGKGTSDSSLLFGHPQPIRSDEWLVATQLTIAQASNDYIANNDNYPIAKNLGIVTDVPTKEWATLFKPQNLGFFILPFEFAFAFKWWLLLLVLIVASYYFVLKLTKGRLLIAICTSILISFSPFVFWWYQTATIGPLAYGFLILLIMTSIIDGEKWSFFGKSLKKNYQQTFIKSVCLTYILVAFALILYPPFQIPVAIVIAAFLAGYVLNKRSTLKRSHWKKIGVTIGIALLLTATICGAYLLTHKNEIREITSTVYPGKREVKSGGFDVNTLLVTYLQPQLQRSERGANYILNQSESSNFIILPIFFLIPSIAIMVWLYIKKRRIDWLLVTLLLCTLLFFAHLFLPLPIFITKLFFLHMVPQSRLLIGLGFLGILLMIRTIMVINENIKQSRKTILVSAAYTLIYFGIIVLSGVYIAELYPNFVSSKKLIALLAVVPTLGFFLLLIGRLRIGIGILTIFSLATVIFIHPLYVGLGPIYKSEVSAKIQALSTPASTWAAANDIFIENLPQMSDRKAITGVNPYPSLDFWKKYSDDPTIYNRYAHVFLADNDTASLILVQPDLFAVSSACTRPISKEIDFIITTSPMTGSCDKLVDTLKYPTRTFYFYSVSHNN